jgi:hypothetical protein
VNRRWFIGLLGGAAAKWLIAKLLAAAALVAAVPALAHSSYPLASCGNVECFPVVCDHLVETGSGWFYVSTDNSSMPRARPRTPLDLRVHRAECVSVWRLVLSKHALEGELWV